MCRADPGEWRKVERALLELLSRPAPGWVRRELASLLRDLYSWDPSEEVCYDEFWARIARYSRVAKG